MKVPITNSLKGRIFAALITAGVAGPSAYVAVDLTVPSEGVMTHLHLDPVGLQTTCIGHLVKKGEKPKQNYTEQECVNTFVSDYKEHAAIVDSSVKVPYKSEWMKGALVDFTFNKGGGAFKNSTLLKKLNGKNYEGACLELTKWVYGTVNGKKVKLKGLEVRASKQYKYCMGEEPTDYRPSIKLWNETSNEEIDYAKYIH